MWDSVLQTDCGTKLVTRNTVSNLRVFVLGIVVVDPVFLWYIVSVLFLCWNLVGGFLVEEVVWLFWGKLPSQNLLIYPVKGILLNYLWIISCLYYHKLNLCSPCHFKARKSWSGSKCGNCSKVSLSFVTLFSLLFAIFSVFIYYNVFVFSLLIKFSYFIADHLLVK